MAKPALLMTGPMMPLIENGCDAAFTVHRLWQAADREALIRQVAPDIRAICTGGHTGVKTDDALMGRFPTSGSWATSAWATTRSMRRRRRGAA